MIQNHKMNMNVGVPFILQREIFLFSLPSPHLLSQGCRGEKSMFQSSSIYWHRWFFVFPFQSRQTKLKIISFQAIILGGGTKYESSNPRWILMSFQHISMGENDFLNLVVILTLHICIEILRFWAFFPYLATTWDDDRSTFSLHEISLDYV